MRSLIEEYGHTLIALIIAAAVIVTVIFGIAIPQIKSHTERAIPNDSDVVSASYTATANVIARPSPQITVSPISTIQMLPVFLNDFISSGSISATNADGVDITNKLSFRPADEITASLYNEEDMSFSAAIPGEYKFIVFVRDITDEENFGKESKTSLIITVIPADSDTV